MFKIGDRVEHFNGRKGNVVKMVPAALNALMDKPEVIVEFDDEKGHFHYVYEEWLIRSTLRITVRRNRDWDEWIVVDPINPDANYHTNDKIDAINTAKVVGLNLGYNPDQITINIRYR